MAKFEFKEERTMTLEEKIQYRNDFKKYKRETKAYIYLFIIFIVTFLMAIITN